MDTINAFAQAMSDGDLVNSLKEGAGDALTVLLVEDEKSQAMLIAALLGHYGHKAHIAFSGEQAIEMFRQIKPDLVLMDVIMPGLNGYETTKAIRAEHKEWVPIIFLSGRTEKADRLYALKVGGDDFFAKPVDPAELLAKMNVMSRIHGMQKRLNQYVAEHEEEDELAAYVMDRYLNASQNDPRVEFSILSASHHFSGDAICVAKTPEGGLNVMMVDAMGHGLPAAINVLPAIQAFYAMSNRGKPLKELVGEINDKVRQLSPPGRFLAGTFIHLNHQNSEVTGWIGGTPKIYLYKAGEIQSFNSSNLSLGILPSSKLDFEFFSAPWSDQSMLVTCTDGVIECQGANGNDLGDQWVYDLIQKHGDKLDKALFDNDWKQSLAGNKPHDDASVLIINQRIDQGN
jgi:DNA-binding response OmpR family regulator